MACKRALNARGPAVPTEDHSVSKQYPSDYINYINQTSKTMLGRNKPLWHVNTLYHLVLIFAILHLLPFDFPWRHTHPDRPVYDRDDHDVCRASAWFFITTLAWYFALMFTILRTSHAFQQEWGQRLLIYPNLAVGVLGLGGIYALYLSFANHKEEEFARVMGLLNGMMLIAIWVYCTSFVKHALMQGLKYGWNALFVTTGLFLLGNISLSFMEEQWYVGGYLCFMFVLFLVGFVDTRSWARKDPYKF